MDSPFVSLLTISAHHAHKNLHGIYKDQKADKEERKKKQLSHPFFLFLFFIRTLSPYLELNQ